MSLLTNISELSKTISAESRNDLQFIGYLDSQKENH